MTELTSKERIIRTYKHQETDRIPMIDYAWNGTVRRWQNEGLPKDIYWDDYFGFDSIVRIQPDNSPRFPRKVIEKNDRYSIVTSNWGATMKTFNELDSTDEMLHYHYGDKANWEQAKKAMLTYHEDRIPWDFIKDNYAKWKAEGRFMQLVLWFGFDVAHSHMIGTENFLMAMIEDPEWVTDVFETFYQSTIDLCQRILDAGYEFDGIFWYDDMGYKNTPFFSPQMYRELLKPYHKRAVDWAHERGMVTEIHSCGFIEPLLPDLLETGVEMLNPIEIKAGMDPYRLKSLYGDKLAFHGGINAQLWDNIDLVKAEMERVIPVLKEGGGYIFASDHSIPNSVSFQTMGEIAKLAKKLGKY